MTQVGFNSEAGQVSGEIIKKHTQDVDFKGHTRCCSPEDPRFEITSDKTEHIAMHKTDALTKID